MATERTYDYDYLRKLFREHPDWAHRQIADAVTEHERTTRSDPDYPRITVAAVASAKYRYKDTWREQGDTIAVAPKDPHKRSQPFKNLPKEYWHNQNIANLRILTRLASGETGISEKKVKDATSFARKLDASRQVVDLDFRGRPYLRPARADELDQEGNLVDFYARYPGLTDDQWAALDTPAARAAASSQWRAS